MSAEKVYRAIGLMSGTSLDGVDVALIETDGHTLVKPLDFVTMPYREEEREAIRAAFGQTDRKNEIVQKAENIVTDAHIKAVQKTQWLEKYEIDIIGFHGQTIYHAPNDGLTIQIGDGAAMAQALNINVVNDFRSADVAAGGQGAPLAPLYHYARAQNDGVPSPCIFLNIGGVANVTYIDDGDVLAFDTGPGNALMDDWVKSRTGEDYDVDGILAAVGNVITPVIKDWLMHPYFKQKPPKSLDRDEWDIAEFGRIVRDIDQIETADGCATLLEFTAQTILEALNFVPHAALNWYVCGGGRHNDALMKRLARDIPIKKVEDLGWNGDATEAECFAYLAVRSLLGEPISLPTTTGIAKPRTGGVLHKP